MENLKNTFENNIYNDLKKKLLNKEIPFSIVRNELLKLDQNDASRNASDKNLDFLLEDEVVEFVKNQNIETLSLYNRFLSFTEFHVGQRLAFTDVQKSITHFKNSLKYSLENLEKDIEWNAYVQGTLMYAQGEKIPEEILNSVFLENNKKILLKLNKGLETRGYPDYSIDY